MSERTPAVRTVRVNDIALTYYDWRAPPGADTTPLVFAHATGFHGRVFDAVIEHFAQHRVLALDLRGHGRSEGGPIDHWRSLTDDLVAFIDRMRVRGAVGVGHSMGAHALVQCASERSDAFASMVLFDPVILAPEFYAADAALYTSDAPHPAIRRKRDFASPEGMMERFGDRDPYCLFERRVFEDYCRHGLRAKPGGEYELACTPETEASVYATSRSNTDIHDAARSVAAPTLIVRAKQTELTDFKSSPTWPALASIMPGGTDMHRPDRTHFHPFEDPGDAARIIARAIAG